MSKFKNARIVGELVKVRDEKENGVITRIDKERGLIYILFKRMREEAYPFPESLDQEVIVLVKK